MDGDTGILEEGGGRHGCFSNIAENNVNEVGGARSHYFQNKTRKKIIIC